MASCLNLEGHVRRFSLTNFKSFPDILFDTLANESKNVEVSNFFAVSLIKFCFNVLSFVFFLSFRRN